MGISNVQPSGGPSWPDRSESKLQRLDDLWNQWYKKPTKGNGEKLLHFLERNQPYFENMAEGKPVPAGWPPNTPFSHYYDTAVARLGTWIQEGCDPTKITSVSEWINDVIVWEKGPGSS